jgi:hypothetical protein
VPDCSLLIFIRSFAYVWLITSSYWPDCKLLIFISHAYPIISSHWSASYLKWGYESSFAYVWPVTNSYWPGCKLLIFISHAYPIICSHWSASYLKWGYESPFAYVWWPVISSYWSGCKLLIFISLLAYPKWGFLEHQWHLILMNFKMRLYICVLLLHLVNIH